MTIIFKNKNSPKKTSLRCIQVTRVTWTISLEVAR